MCSIYASNDHRTGTGRWYARVSGHLIGAAVGAAAFVAPALAAPPPAGTVIGNQAVATFDSGGQTYSVTSNEVETTINTIAGIELDADTTKSGAPGGKVFFPHTVTNTGNAPDTIALSAGNEQAGITIVAIYPDADCDGVPDTLTQISSTPSLSPGQQFCVVTEVDVDESVTTGNTATYEITAETSLTGAENYDPGPPVQPSALNTDTVEFTDTAVFEFSKSMTLETDADSSGSVTPGDSLRVRLTYTNSGMQPATDVVISDPLPAELEYELGQASWSDGGTMTDASGNTDHTNGQGHTIEYEADDVTGQVTATISEVPQGRTGHIEFVVVVADDASGTIENIATIDSNETDPEPTNTSSIAVEDSDAIRVTLADSQTVDGVDDGVDPDTNLGGALVSTTDDGTTDDDVIQETGEAAEGSIVNFSLVIENHGNTTERFNLSADLGSGATPFPAGTTFSFFTDTGAVILDSNPSDGLPDIVVAGNTARLIDVRADLPTGFTRAAADPANQGEITATSLSEPSVANTTTIELANDVSGAAVDLQNDDGGNIVAVGPDVTDAGDTPWVTEALDPGETAVFTLVVENNALTPDSFNLAYSDDVAAFDPANFVDGSLPAGWQVVFRDSTGSVVTNTGVIDHRDSGNNTAVFTAEVTVPASEVPGDWDIFFRARSATNPAVEDVKMDRVTVSEIVDVAIRSHRSAQAAPGGVVVMSHPFENIGNVDITAGAIEYVAPGFDTFSASIYLDVNADGQHDPGDVLISDIADIVTELGGFAPGDTVMLLSRVQVPSTSVDGLSETATLQVSEDLTSALSGAATDRNTGNNSVTETVTVVSGDLEVVKLQARDVGCDGDPTNDPDDVDYTEGSLDANPGDCILYRIDAVNTGSANATNVRIDDEVPNLTTLEIAVAAAGGDTPAVHPTYDGSTGPVRTTHGELLPGGVATMEFGVRIDF